MSRSREFQERLVAKVEETIRRLETTGHELRTIAESQRSIAARNHLNSIADHLDVLARGLSVEIRNEPRGLIVSALAGFGRVAIGALLAIPVGIGEEVGEQLIESVQRPATEAEETLGELTAVAAAAAFNPAEALPEDESEARPSGAGFSGTQAAKIVGITYRELDYWARTGLIRPSLAEATGSGSRRMYSYRDLLELRMIKTLLDSGIKLESVRDVFANLRADVGTDISAANIVISGTESIVLQTDDELVELMGSRGQGVLNVLPLGGVKSEVDAGIESLRSESDQDGA